MRDTCISNALTHSEISFFVNNTDFYSVLFPAAAPVDSTGQAL